MTLVLIVDFTEIPFVRMIYLRSYTLFYQMWIWNGKPSKLCRRGSESPPPHQFNGIFFFFLEKINYNESEINFCLIFSAFLFIGSGAAANKLILKTTQIFKEFKNINTTLPEAFRGGGQTNQCPLLPYYFYYKAGFESVSGLDCF